MEDFITYFLKGKEENSNEYYRVISDFTDAVLDKIKEAEFLISDFAKFSKKVNDIRDTDEYKLEFLMIGVFWDTYIKNAVSSNAFSEEMLKVLFNLRRKVKSVKSKVDMIRGKLSYKCLLNKDVKLKKILFTRKNLSKLILWLEASGEFRYEAKRIRKWESFLQDKKEEYIQNMLETALKTALWFEKEAKDRLGRYTLNVNNFLNNSYKGHLKKEDNILCGRREVEYHLNMVGAEILNRVFREDFIMTKKKNVFLPSCMCFRPEGECRKKKAVNGFSCAGCSKDCKVNKLTVEGKKKNFGVFIIPHETDVFSDTKETKYKDIGIVGIACTLNLIEGGYKARNMNLVPQCVILDYCGCRNHWSKAGIKTDINDEKLKEILQIK